MCLNKIHPVFELVDEEKQRYISCKTDLFW
jgi:hypothetical protein